MTTSTRVRPLPDPARRPDFEKFMSTWFSGAELGRCEACTSTLIAGFGNTTVECECGAERLVLG